MTAVVRTLRPRHWSLALGGALLLHGGLLVAFHDMLDGGTVAPGIGGIHVGLPPAGAAPGAPAESAAAEAPAVAPVEAATVPPAPVEEARPVPEVETASEAAPPEAAVPPEAVPLYAPVETVEAVEPPEEQTEAEAPPPVEPEVVETEEVEPVEEVVAETPMAVPPPPKAKPEPPVAERPVAEAPQPVTAPEAALGETQTAATGPQEGPPAAADEVVGNAGKAGSGDRAATGAAEGHSGGGAPGAFVDYKAQLLAWLEKHKEYPRRARLRRQEGTALLQFVMDRSGKVLEYRILESSGYKLLDEEVVAMIERASPLPTPPAAMAGERFDYTVPIWFNQR